MSDDFEERVFKGLFDDFTSYIGHDSYMLMRSCESPIEIMLGLAILSVGFMRGGDCHIVLMNFVSDRVLDGGSYYLVPQYNITVGDDRCRSDFAIFEQGQPAPLMIIECDGHDFHERTKRQAARDRRRDRAFQAAGLPILRFTGSEIYADPCECAREVFRMLDR